MKGSTMQIKCIKTSFAEDHEMKRYYANDLNGTLYISRDKIYTVYGMRCSNTLVEYLIQDDNYYPAFYPANLFDVVDSPLPYEEWHFGKFQYPVINSGIIKYFYMFGSKEMATDYDLLMSIILHDREGLFHFEEWRKLIDRQYE
jgi:hypothetical protein